jgi:hypothetical protein
MENILHEKGKKRFKKVKRKKEMPTIHLHLVTNIKLAQQKELKPAPSLRVNAPPAYVRRTNTVQR